MAAFYQQIPVGHVEAGLRTHNIYSPWPEEMNRQLTGRMASYHFAPTELSRDNLLVEGIATDRIFITGNTVIDALQQVVTRVKGNADLRNEVSRKLLQFGYDVNRLEAGRRLVLITGHRRENFGEGFLNICRAIQTLSKRFPEVDFAFAVVGLIEAFVTPAPVQIGRAHV